MNDVEIIGKAAQPMTAGSENYDSLLALIGDARLALLGKATHGTHEFYFERAEITKVDLRKRIYGARD